ncbi:hypothetical protein SCB71_11710 [Herbiconiux sp. KACC 21604]|uniref:hypothetical protein n=1 Tax=unclassified Herbiconiux TaxID=2618217 RepID=UPI00149175AA|nr:hypothetical protein [Herbiconiux sp. SALV-R1]QJU53872.1 hypothetical protein HL652_09660 [Herbiconiux sp. SALV-R1]WPO84885.1 hypothetical protein SCB71_11710 [Herbiconiux sp. KACC 21604]
MRGVRHTLLTVVLITGVLLMATLVGAAGGTGAAAATTTESGVEVSSDGARFSRSLDLPLFQAAPTVVPGDSVTRTLWVRNSGELPGVLRLSVVDGWWTSAAFAEELLLSAEPAGVAAPAGGAELAPSSTDAVPLARGAECAVLLSGGQLDPGETVALQISVTFAASATGRTGHDAEAGFDLVAGLRDPADPTAGSDDCAGGAVVPALPDRPSAGAGDPIAATGLAAVALAMAGSVGVVAGAAALASVRRRRTARSPRGAEAAVPTQREGRPG